MKFRKEFDSIGSVKVPDEKYWGASTQRSKRFFNIGKILVNSSIIKSIAIIKRSAALVHAKDKQIDQNIAKTIVKASDEVIKGYLDGLVFLFLFFHLVSQLLYLQSPRYHSQLKKSIHRIEIALKEIFNLAQGGTAVGTGINSKKNFDKKIIKEISNFTKIPFKPTDNKFAELAAHDAIINFSGALNTCAVALMKVSNDIRFLGSGPRAVMENYCYLKMNRGHQLCLGKLTQLNVRL